MDGFAGDLQAKYQKVASEYSKVRAQVLVLKKAVLDEQTKSSELRDMLKEREQSLRKAEQEMDSLTFRNQQLMKRVTVLQDELEVMSKSKKGKGKIQDQMVHSVREVMGEELQKAITDNARLINLVQEKEECHKLDLDVHCQRIEFLEHELRQQQEQYKKALAKLESEKVAAITSTLKSTSAGFESPTAQKVDTRLESLQKSNSELTAHARELNSQRLHLTSQLEEATRVIRAHLPFVDSNDRELNELNIPHHDRGHQATVVHIVSLAGCFVEEFLNALENFHFHFRQQLIAVHGSLSPLNLKFSEHLKESSRILLQLKQGYLDFQQGINCVHWSGGYFPSLISFSGPLRSYNSFLQKLSPYLNLSIEEECVLSDASAEQRSANHEVIECSSYFNVQITKICGYICLLAGQNRKFSQHPFTSQQRFLKELAGALNTLHQATQGLLCAYTGKLSLQKDLKKPSNEMASEESDGLICALSSAVSSSGKLTDLLDSYLKSSSQSTKKNIQNHPSVLDFHKRTANYLASLEQEEPASIPYEEALKIHGELRNGEESCKALMSQLLAVQGHAAQAEREREHWHQEFQFLHVRQESAEVSGSSTVSSRPTAIGSADGEGGKTSVTNLLGKLTAPVCLPQEIEAREEKLKRYFRERSNELVARSQNAESKATTFIAECAVLKARLEDAVQSQKASENRASKLSEELAATVQSYDSQLAVMSEHLANMNEKLALQKDTIDHLKFQNVQSKGMKKNKQK